MPILVCRTKGGSNLAAHLCGIGFRYLGPHATAWGLAGERPVRPAGERAQASGATAPLTYARKVNVPTPKKCAIPPLDSKGTEIKNMD